MARDFRGVPFSTLPEPTAPDFTFRLRNMLSEIDAWARDTSQGMGRIANGQVPNGSGDPLPGTGIEIPNDVGAVLFVGAGPVLDTDGSVFFWNTTRSLLGVGTNAPAARVHLDLDSAVAAKPNTTVSGGNAAGSEWSSNVAGLLTAGSGVPDASVDIDEGFPANDGDWIRSNGTPGTGFSECIFGLNGVIPLGEGSYTVTIRAAKDTTGNPAAGFFIKLYRADGFGEISSDMFTSMTTSFATYTTTITIGPSPSLSGGTANSIAFRTVGNPGERWLIAAVTVSAGTAGTDLLRWDANSIQSGRISDTGHMGIGTSSDALDPMLVVESDAAATIGQKIKGFTAQSGNLLEFRNSSDTLLSRFTSAGVYDGPINTTSSGSDVTLSGGTVVLDGASLFYAPKVIVGTGGSPLGFGFALDDSSGFFGEIQGPAAGLTADRAWVFPDGSGQLVLATVSADLRGSTSTILLTNTSSSGTSLADTNTNSKRLRFVLSGAVGNNFMTIATTAARGYTFGDVSSGVTQLGIAASAAGTLGRSVLTGQSASIGATTLLTSTTVTAGLYRVSFYLKTTTAGDGGDTVDVTVAWNDGTAQTYTNATAGSARLDAGTLNAYAQFSITVRAAASTAITFTTTLTSPGAGTPVHTLDARLEFLS